MPTEAQVLRCAEAPRARRLWLTPQLGRPGRARRPRTLGVATFDSSRARPVASDSQRHSAGRKCGPDGWPLSPKKPKASRPAADGAAAPFGPLRLTGQSPPPRVRKRGEVPRPRQNERATAIPSPSLGSGEPREPVGLRRPQRSPSRLSAPLDNRKGVGPPAYP
jgi:hypothetical protein